MQFQYVHITSTGQYDVQGEVSRLLPLENGGHESGAPAGPVLAEQQVELVIDAHHLGDAALHHVLEVRVVPEQYQLAL